MQDERKKDVEETAEFINQLIETNKTEQMQEVQRLYQDMSHLKHELVERVPKNELQETKTNLLGQLQGKVELNEVQTALNECQEDIVQQLDEFKVSIQNEMRQMRGETDKSLDCKADALDVQQQLEQKADLRLIRENCAERDQFEQLVQNVNSIMEQLESKCDVQTFQRAIEDKVTHIEDLKNVVKKKSNIKDVCALLDMKSSKRFF